MEELIIKDMYGGDELTIYSQKDGNVTFDIFGFVTTVKNEDINKIIEFLENIKIKQE
ncbi:MAG: hypothetical protein ACP6IQ_02020 [Candidatus Njordarchaeia archaeon]